jgi:hypothetical protein
MFLCVENNYTQRVKDSIDLEYQIPNPQKTCLN